MPDKDKKIHYGTLSVRAGQNPEPITGAIAAPIYQTTNYQFRDVEDGAKKCESIYNGYCYTRLGNPTIAILEEKMAALEGAEEALAFTTGVAAISALLFSQLKQGDHVVVDDTSYSATRYLFDNLLAKFGVEATFIDTSVVENVEPAIRPHTKMIYFESPANPTVKVVDIKAIAEIAKAHHLLSVIDSTFASPIIQRPLDLGIDVVMHSATKFIGGHGDVMGGILCGKKELINFIRDDTYKNMGGVIMPLDAFLLIRGLKTLEVRVQKHCANAMAVAKYLEAHPKVDRVYYPGLPSHPQHELAKRQMNDFGGMITFELKGGLEAGVTFMNSLKFCRLAVSLGDVDTLIQHPASMTHWYVSREERIKAGIQDGSVRMSVGIEDAEDIILDLEQALAQV
ncbi:trans-sulfuration enzyme family protein [Candidatus Formimonas warabiya]|uniref:L-methionine gamma-lyase n=1 Tax=Formimonas warabiya TaxID=1761012 RepID=A0A3G1KLY0_FORW1|nr:aminotransferase class I/II-fold pyridoxal phosphate-dependent enzyme [Candidatus Formimonas warabiya]ATW23427.1 methionine gamma-lyase [Candidatus Formimonas warabiya]